MVIYGYMTGSQESFFENYLLLGLLSPPIKTSLTDGLARTSVTVADVAFADELLALFIEIG